MDEQKQNESQASQVDSAATTQNASIPDQTASQAPPPPQSETPAASPTPEPATSSPSPVPDSSPTPTPPAAQPKKERSFAWVFVLIILFVGFLGLAAWYFQSQLQKSTVSATPTPSVSNNTLPKQLIIGTDPTFKPMEYMDKGKMVGYDIDLANLLAKQLNVKVTFKNITFDNLFPALKQNQIDMIISAVTITPERQKMYAFSTAYLNAGQVIITQKTNTTITSTKQLMGKKIGVQQGTTDEQEALKFTSSNLVIRFPDYDKATSALVAGSIDAIITDLPSAQGIVSSSPSLKISSDPFTNDYYGIVLRKGDPNVQAVNKALNQLQVRGFLTELKYKWLD